ncbi:putative Transcription factor BHLH062 [Cocos nucifera]|uniref:Putative Transcription factor BHLH062 n=1 Tax=Cocos nucifera TaxID=13894 RepID=A0A8K0MYI0_COCNU|nr:putative Transcription factor BHLH062 [Cocos nucifera]
MVADKGKKAKVVERGEEQDSEHIDGELVLSIEKLQEIQDELERHNWYSNQLKNTANGVAYKKNGNKRPFPEESLIAINSSASIWSNVLRIAEVLGYPAYFVLDRGEHQCFFSWFGETQQKSISEGFSDEVAEIIKEDLWPNPLKYFNNVNLVLQKGQNAILRMAAVSLFSFADLSKREPFWFFPVFCEWAFQFIIFAPNYDYQPPGESNSSMISDHPSSMAKETNVAADKPVDGSLLNKKSQGRVPKKIHKAEREKLKREQLNELFLELGHVLEPARQNNGKATILVDTSRILRDLLAQVESLRKENAALLTESSYVTAEKNELRDENAALQADIAELRNELQVRMMSDSVWTNSTDMSPPTLPQPVSTMLPLQQQPPDIRPVHGTPIRELQLFPESTATQTEPTPSSNVMRPHARYPTPSDSWPGQLLSGLPRTAQEEQHLSSTSSVSTISSREEGSDKA